PRPLPMIRALIAGRSRVHGEALAAALSHGRRVRVLATVSHPHEVLARLVEAPDIVLVDYATPEAVRIVADIRRRAPNVRVVESQILNLGVDGMTNTRIDSGLVIELATVKNHVHNILKKLHVHTRIDASTWYRRGGFHLKLDP